jgi:dipeptidyl aminopeptidase/acylaminoacyl peptidase
VIRFVWLAWTFLIAHPICAAGAEKERRAWTSRDSVAVRYYSVDQENPQAWPYPMPGSDSVNEATTLVYSPDRTHFFFVYHYGEADTDSNVYTLQVFEIERVREALQQRSSRKVSPSRQVTMRSYSSVPAIRHARWEPEGGAVLFVGTGERGETSQAYRLALDSDRVEQLTHSDYPVTWVDYRQKGILFRIDRGDERGSAPPPYPVLFIQRRDDGSVLLPGSGSYDDSLMYGYGSQPPRELKSGYVSECRISPDGRKAALIRFQEGGRSLAIIRLDEADSGPLLELKLDWPAAESGDAITVPIQVIWSRDSSRAILVNANLPGSEARSGAEPGEFYVLEYDVSAKKLEVIERMRQRDSNGTMRRIVGVKQIRDGNGIEVTYDDGKSGSRRIYDLDRRSWADAPLRTNEDERPANGESVVVRLIQDANTPPAVVATHDGRSITLSEPDPVLKEVWRARVESVQWQEGNGAVVTAGLMLARNVSPGERLPLVIQAYHYYPQFFLPDGPHSASDAAQVLVSRGMAVLQMGSMDLVGTPDEGLRVVERIDAAIDMLAAKGLIDPSRVGLTGFSRGGYQTYYAITHPGRNVLAAAVAADSFTGAYPRYLIDAGILGSESFESLFGGSFWKNKAFWLERETTFNVDKVRTPILFTEHGGRDRPYTDHSLQTVGAFLLNDKPLEYLYFPYGEHELQRPRERMALIEAVADWMSFWLQGYEDPAAEKQTQYERWRPMRRQ